MQKSITIIIPNWNGRSFLNDCLKSLRSQVFKNFEIIVVDNGSTDGSVPFIKSRFPEIIILENKENLGFAKAINQGIQKANSEFVVLLNNDTMVDKNYLHFLFQAINRKKETCGVAPKILDFKKRDTVDSAGDLINTAGQAFHRGHGGKSSRWNEAKEVFLITAGASIYRRKAFDRVGLLDEDFFAYGEDVDWSLRAQMAGCKFWYEPKAIIYHHQKGTSRKIPKKTVYLQFRNMTLTIIKNFPIGLFLKRWRFLLIPLIHFNTILYMALKGLGKEAISADFWILKNLNKIIKSRKQIQSERKVTLEYLDGFMVAKKIRFWGLFK